jgi:ADP-heptose:LPS heptosyltransferase
MRTVLVVRLDSLGDVLTCGPAVRAVAGSADRVVVLAGPQGAEAARLLPGVDDVIVWTCPWIVGNPPAVDADDLAEAMARVREVGAAEALVLTSFHQSALPTALVLRLAGIPRIAASSIDYAGSLLDVRLPDPAEGPEPVRMLEIARGAGFALPDGDDGRLSIRMPDDAAPTAELPVRPFVVLHPGAAAPSRTPSAAWWRTASEAIASTGRNIVITGSRAEAALCSSLADAAGPPALDLSGSLDLAGLAYVLSRAEAVVAGNTGPAHLAAAVGTPVVSLFAPVVPALRWAPYGVAVELLGDQDAACRATRSTSCPLAGHRCLDGIEAESVVDALGRLARRPASGPREAAR